MAMPMRWWRFTNRAEVNAIMSDFSGPITDAVRESTRRSVLVIRVQSVSPIVAPSYRFYPEETTEASQVAAAMSTYQVKPA